MSLYKLYHIKFESESLDVPLYDFIVIGSPLAVADKIYVEAVYLDLDGVELEWAYEEVSEMLEMLNTHYEFSCVRTSYEEALRAQRWISTQNEVLEEASSP